MRVLQTEALIPVIEKLCIKACCELNDNVMDAFRKAVENEESPIGKKALEIIVKNTGEKSVSKLVEKAVIEYVKNLEHGTNVLASAEEDLLLLKDILKYDNENRCLYPLDHLDYLEDLCYMYYEIVKIKKTLNLAQFL